MPFIPFKRDFDATNLPVDDSQLVPVTVTIRGGVAGTLTPVAQPTGRAVIGFWKDAKKTAAFTSKAIPGGMDPTTVTFYVEGQHESAFVNDTVKVDMIFTLTAMPLVTVKATDNLLVTPIIKSFTASIPTPSVSLQNQGPPPNGLNGVIAYKPPAPGVAGAPGIEFIGQLTNGPLLIKFVQNVKALTNGKNQNVAGAGAVFVVGSGIPKQALSPKPNSNCTYPGLDGTNGNRPTADDFRLRPKPAGRCHR